MAGFPVALRFLTMESRVYGWLCGTGLHRAARLRCNHPMPDMPDRRKRPRHQTPVEVLRRLRDALLQLQAAAEADNLEEAVDALAEAAERIEADIKRRLV